MNNLNTLRDRLISLNNNASNSADKGKSFEKIISNKVSHYGFKVISFVHYYDTVKFAIRKNIVNESWLLFELKNGGLYLSGVANGKSKKYIKNSKNSLIKMLKKLDIDKLEKEYWRE